MIRTLALLATVAFAGSMGVADAANKNQCHDPKTGKFVKCPVTAPKPKPKQCHDPKTGKFVKCPTY